MSQKPCKTLQLSWLERRTVNPCVIGSSPIFVAVLVAQLVLAVVCEAIQQGFDSPLTPCYQKMNKIKFSFTLRCSSIGGTFAFDAKSCVFESHHLIFICFSSKKYYISQYIKFEMYINWQIICFGCIRLGVQVSPSRLN